MQQINEQEEINKILAQDGQAPIQPQFVKKPFYGKVVPLPPKNAPSKPVEAKTMTINPTQLTKSPTDKQPFTQEQLTLIRNTVARGANMDEFKLFLYTANRTKLDPLTHQIYFVKRKTKFGEVGTIQTGIDGYRAIAERTGQLAGIDDAVYDNEDKPNPKKASVSVYRMVNNQRVAFTASARWSEYAPTGTQAFMWSKMPYLMLGKCAEALALRKAFPNDLSGLYTNEEMAQASNEPVEQRSQEIDKNQMFENTKNLIQKVPTEKKEQAIMNAINSKQFTDEQNKELKKLK